MMHDKPILLISSSLKGSWASQQQLIFASHHATLQVTCVMPGSVATQAEIRKHHSNDAKCRELGWVCIPLVVKYFACWGPETLSRLAGILATRQRQPKTITINQIYGRL